MLYNLSAAAFNSGLRSTLLLYSTNDFGESASRWQEVTRVAMSLMQLLAYVRSRSGSALRYRWPQRLTGVKHPS